MGGQTLLPCWQYLPTHCRRCHPRGSFPASPCVPQYSAQRTANETVWSRRRPRSKLQAVCQAGKACETALPPLLPAEDTEAHQFSSFANWIIPAHLMVGRYPFVDPNRYRRRIAGEQVLRQILGAGITRFVCLQEELPPQDQMGLRGANGFLPYQATATLLAAASDGHAPSQEVTGLRNPHLNQFLPPRRSKQAGSSAMEQPTRRRLQFTHVPIVDLGLPSLDQVQSVVEDMGRWMKQGDIVYMHCWGGRGRAGTMAACILVHHYGLGGQEALKRVQLAYDTRGEGRNSPETSAQHNFVLEYAGRI
ncbi:hypothetical protein WJX73_006802 [Symbiochloris irregularis]|uniref:Tyrosine specific protein phosphatases domain-containing protein n=1 Tax=Symbiochloris irregularis TaxID=706552 RepID=A0AAW1PYN8_9CHLO